MKHYSALKSIAGILQFISYFSMACSVLYVAYRYLNQSVTFFDIALLLGSLFWALLLLAVAKYFDFCINSYIYHINALEKQEKLQMATVSLLAGIAENAGIPREDINAVTQEVGLKYE